MNIDMISGSAPGWPLVLYFHHVSDSVNHYTCMPTEVFVALLEGLADHFTFVCPSALHTVGEDCTQRRVLLTFDDGYMSQYSYAVPAMQTVGASALFFVNPALIDGRPTADPPLREPLMTWDHLRELQGRGHIIGSHGQSHASATSLTQAEWRKDLASSQVDIRRHLGDGGRQYAYPFGNMPTDPTPLAEHFDLAFGTVKADPVAWDKSPFSIRRVFVPNEPVQMFGRIQQWSHIK